MYHRNFDHAVVIIHTHSDDSTGDLWYRSNNAESEGPAATPINDVCISLLMSDSSDGFSSSLMQSLALTW